MGITLGTAMAGITATAETQEKLTQSERKVVEPRFVPRILGNMAATQITITHGIKGPSITVSTACASGGDAISEASRLLLTDEADAVIAVGAESTICPLVMLSLSSARALSRENEVPSEACRPFDKGHNVFITSGDRLFELSGAQELVKQTMIDGFWNVVDDIKLAHFVMRYEVTLEGRDKAYLYFSTPNSNNEVKISSTGGSESIIDNREIARRLYLNSVFPMYKKIEEKNYPKQFSVFGIKKTKQ